ncbi:MULTISPECIES: BPSL0761 family protein [unclassified Pseudoxanthomonas]|uniref:BPSL0761 family protein n=1 Tax=unclassified Pseudoxanthomonas TaxID=2645906 RepID=UPI003F4FF84E
MPSERTRAIVWAGGLLLDIARDRTLPVALRRRAVVIARHFLTIDDVFLMANAMKQNWHRTMLAPLEQTEAEDAGDHGPLTLQTRLGWLKREQTSPTVVCFRRHFQLHLIT